MDKNKWHYIGYGLAWMSTAVAVSIGIYVTKSASPLWAMLIPSFISLSTGSKEKPEESKE